MSKILIIDDETSIREFAYMIFSQEGHEVSCAARGSQALDIVEKQRPDLILMDLQMPGEQGLSLLKKLQAKDRKIPVAVFSGTITPEIEKDAFDAGALEVIEKGIDIKSLKERITKVLNSKDRIFSDANDKEQNNERSEKILIVDDEEGIRKFLAEFFNRKGFKTIEAHNGEKAIELTKKEKPSVILLDFNMPGMDGIMTLKRIREIDPDVGVVMATSMQDEQIAQEASALGSYHYVLKPFDLKYLELVVLTRLTIAS